MSDYAHAINQHYGQAELSTKILTALRAAGKDLEALTRDDLGSFDELHDGGREGARELARLAGLRPGMHVLDIGSGLGGPARTLAAEYGCQVTGLDLAEEFCQAAEMLTTRVGLSDRVTFRQRDALHLPFAPGSFDVVWTQYALMNIADKARLVQEAHRVLRPGGGAGVRCAHGRSRAWGALPRMLGQRCHVEFSLPTGGVPAPRHHHGVYRTCLGRWDGVGHCRGPQTTGRSPGGAAPTESPSSDRGGCATDGGQRLTEF
jgi:ubiquinone/menaquinone biosynthesis C-methylase UbiE